MEKSESAYSSFKAALTIAVIAAIVGGAFTLVPIAYDAYKGRVEITTSILRSKVLTTDQKKQIVIAEVQNSGRITIRDIEIFVVIPTASYTDVSIDAPDGVGSRSSVDDGVRIHLEELNSGETARVSFLAEAADLEQKEDFSVRARDLPSGSIKDRQEKTSFSPLLFFLGAFVYGFLTLFVARFAVRRFRGLRHLPGFPGDLDRDDALDFIGRIYFSKHDREDLFSSGTWRGAADAIFIAFSKGMLDKAVAKNVLMSLVVAGRNMNVLSRDVLNDYLTAHFDVTKEDLENLRSQNIPNIRRYLMEASKRADILAPTSGLPQKKTNKLANPTAPASNPKPQPSATGE